MAERELRSRAQTTEKRMFEFSMTKEPCTLAKDRKLCN